MSEFMNTLLHSLMSFGIKLLIALLVAVIGRFLIKKITNLLRRKKFTDKQEVTVVHFLLSFTSVTLHAVLIVLIISILGIPTASIVTVIASAGVAIGLALQGALSNLAGGIMILIFHPFRIDDFIEASDHLGTVKDIGIFYTVLTTPDNKDITIPNGTMMGESIINYSVNGTRRVDFVFSVAYGTDTEKVKTVLLEEANRHELVLKEPEPFARLSRQNESSLDFTLRVFANSADYWQVNFDLLENVNKRFAKEGIPIPFPQLDVHLSDGQK